MSNNPNLINNLSGTQLDNYIINELYKKINCSREMFQIPKLYPDSSAQIAIQNILIELNNFTEINENNIESYLIKENFVSKQKIILNFKNSKPKTNINSKKNLLESFYALIDENCINSNMPLMSKNNCFTHIGLNIKYDENNGSILIVIILSQKIISVENSYTLKDGYVIIGSILLNNCYIAAAKIKKNDKISYDIGPRNLILNTEKMKYGIFLPNVNFKDLIIRKIMCYCLLNQINENIPYLDPNARAATVQWNTLELGVCQIINFKEGINEFNQLTIKDFLKKEFGIDVNISNLTHNKNNNNVISLVQRLNQGKNNNQNILNNNNINNNINNQNVVLTPSRNNNNLNNKLGNFNIMSTIPEEKNNLNKSIFFSNKNFIGSPIPKNNNNNNDFLGSLNNNNSNIQNIIGSKLQKAEELNGNINNIKIDNNKVSPFNINNNDFSFCGNNNCIPNNNNIINQNNNNINQNNNNYINQNNNIINQNNNNNINQNNNNYINQNNNNMNQNNNMINYVISKQNNNSNNMPLNNTMNNSNFNPNLINNNNVFQQSNQNYFQNNNNNNLSYNGNSYLINQNNNNNPINIQNYNNNIFNQMSYLNRNSKNYLEYFKTYQIPNNVISWQIIPLELKFKNLLNITGVGQHFPNEQLKLSFKHNEKIIINLSQISSGNIQTYSIIPQTKIEFFRLLLKEIENFQSSKEDINKFINGNLVINIEDTNGKIFKLTNDNFLSFSKSNFNLSKKISIDKNNISNKDNLNQSKPKIQFIKQLLNSNLENNNLNNSKILKNQYLIENFIFKENINNQEKLKSLNFVTESFNDKILQYITKKYLTEEESKIPFNYNKSYEELYYSRNFCDIILCIRGEEIYSHKVVLISASPIFKNMIKINEKNNTNFSNEILKIVLPESYNIKIFKEIFKWIYCGKFHNNITIDDMREILLMAENLKMFSLQKILIVKYIIPNMTKESALIFLKDTYKKSISKETKDCWTLLSNFSINCISKNSSSLIKSNISQFLTMDIELLIKCIEHSVNYLVEEIHLSLLLKLLIDKGYAKDIFELVNKVSEKFKMCRNFDVQNINIENIFNEHNSNNPFYTYLINEETISKGEVDLNGNFNDNLSQNNINTSPFYLPNSIFESSNKENYSFGLSNYNKLLSFGPDNNNINNNNNNLNEKNNNIEKEKNEEKTFSSLSPCINSNPNIDIKKNKKPNFEFSFQIENKNTEKITIFSEKFNTKNRNWCLKIDIEQSGDVSFFLVEIGINNNININYNMGYNLNFTSVLFDFSIRDISFEKNGIIFFSFVNNQYQIIGYKKFFNLKQLGKKNILNFIIYIKEFPLHSACLQYLSDNFQPLFLGKKGKCDLKESIILKQEKKENENLSYLDLYSNDITSILYNNNLRVDNENNIISALYMYCLNKEPKIIDNIMESIRYEFVDFKIMCTLARDHDIIKHSPSFKKGFTIELNERIKKLSNNQNNNNNVFSKRFIKRKYYTINDSICNLNISNELISFFLEKNHHDGYIDKVNKLKKEIENERKVNDERMQILKKENAILNNDKINLTREIKKMKYHSNNINKSNQISSSIMNERQNNTINNFKNLIANNAKNCIIF